MTSFILSWGVILWFSCQLFGSLEAFWQSEMGLKLKKKKLTKSWQKPRINMILLFPVGKLLFLRNQDVDENLIDNRVKACFKQ